MAEAPAEVTLVIVNAFDADSEDEITVFLEPTGQSSPEILDGYWVQRATGYTQKERRQLERRWPEGNSTPDLGEGWHLIPESDI